ncbi:MAG TPA: serine hydrolase domain-containing protein, partial [Streptosporangiaceae bacterium]
MTRHLAAIGSTATATATVALAGIVFACAGPPPTASATLTTSGTTVAGTTVAGATAAAPAPLPPLDPVGLRAAISGLPNSTVTGALVNVTGPAGQWNGTAGVRDIVSRVPIPADGDFRIGSIAKVFTAVVVLQLAAEHRVDLGVPIQHYLPGLLPASYPPITVRQLLNFTSGLPDSTLGNGDPAWFAAHRFQSWTPEQLVAEAVSHPLVFPPGTAQQYNGTGYYLAGLLIEHLTGHSYA